ncbi:hypothetical protein ACHAPT_003930 [Fusarium lateritium]
MAASPPRQPLTEDGIYHIGFSLLPAPWERAPSPAEQGDFERNIDCLRRLTYLSRATKRLLEPLLFRFVLLGKPSDVVHFYIDLIQRPHISQYVRHMACVTNRPDPGNYSDLPCNRMCRRILDERIGGRENFLSLMKQGAAWDTLALACSRRGKNAEGYFERPLNMRADVDYMIRSILLTMTSLKTLVWRYDEFGTKSFKAHGHLQLAATLGRAVLPALEVMALDANPLRGSHIDDFPWGKSCWKNLRRLVLYDDDFDDEFAWLIFRDAFKGLVPVEELVVRRKEGCVDDPYKNMIIHPISLNPEDRIYLVGNEELFCIFPDLKLLEISFGYFAPRNRDGSVMLKGFLHWVKAPERIHLTGHPPPFDALATGPVHSRLKSIRVMEWKDEEELGQDEMRQRVEDWWRRYSRVVPNLEEFVVQREGESEVYAKAPC